MNSKLYLYDLEKKFNKINPSEYYLSYSGGKDSHFLYWFITEYAKIEGIKIVGCNTFMEHSSIRERMYKYSDIVLIPELSPKEVHKKYGMPCFSKGQDEWISRYQRGSRTDFLLSMIEGTAKSKFQINKKARELLLSGKLHKVSNKCCEYLKKRPFKKFEKETGLKPILGVRGSESLLRKSKYNSCFTLDRKFTPIFDLRDELINEIYEKYDIELPIIYDHINRTGCMGCPYGSNSGNTLKELKLLTPSQLTYVADLFDKSYEVLGIDIEMIKKEKNYEDN